MPKHRPVFPLIVVLAVTISGCASAPIPASSTKPPTVDVTESPEPDSEPAEAARSGQLYVWGDRGPVVAAAGVSVAPTPVAVPDMADVVSAASTGDSIAAVKSDGSVWTWGQVSPDSPTTLVEPTQVPGVEGAVQVVSVIPSGAYQILTSDGSVYFYGDNRGGGPDAGYGLDRFSFTAIPIESLSGIKQIAPNTALAEDGTVYVWGCRSSRFVPGLLEEQGSCIGPEALDLSGLGEVKAITRFNVLAGDGRVWEIADGALSSAPSSEAIFATPENRYFVTAAGDVWADGVSTNGGLGVPGAEGLTQVPDLRGLRGVGWGYDGGTIAVDGSGSVWFLATQPSTYPSSIAPSSDGSPVQWPEVEGAFAVDDGFILVGE